jgi:hypothetical protein
LARDAIKAGDFPIEVLVETVTSRGNVKRAAEKAGCTVQVEEMGRIQVDVENGPMNDEIMGNGPE